MSKKATKMKTTKMKTKTTKNKNNEQDGLVTFEWISQQNEFFKLLFHERVKAGLYHLWRGKYYIDNHNNPVLKKEVLKNVRNP